MNVAQNVSVVVTRRMEKSVVTGPCARADRRIESILHTAETEFQLHTEHNH